MGRRQPCEGGGRPSSLRQLLEADLRAALRERDGGQVSVLRVALAIANAEAVDPGARTMRAGLGGDVARRLLSETDIHGILTRECREYGMAAEGLQRAGQAGAAAELRRRAATLAGYLRE